MILNSFNQELQDGVGINHLLIIFKKEQPIDNNRSRSKTALENGQPGFQD